MIKYILVIILFYSYSLGFFCIPCPCGILCTPDATARLGATNTKFINFFKKLNHELKEQMDVLDDQNFILQKAIKHGRLTNQFKHEVNLMVLKYRIHIDNTQRSHKNK